MRAATARVLVEMNARFYEKNAVTFSQTRTAPWPGWQKLAGLECFEKLTAKREDDPLKVLDLACGNLRFEHFLENALPNQRFDVIGIDSCPELFLRGKRGFERSHIEFEQRDLIGDLLASEPAADLSHLPESWHPDLVVSFGFFHHIPARKLRERFLAGLLDMIGSGGVLAISCWRYLEDAGLCAKAMRALDAAPDSIAEDLEPGDGFLGWQEDLSALRYCHSFSDGEISAFEEMGNARGLTTTTYRADGKSGELDSYLVYSRPA